MKSAAPHSIRIVLIDSSEIVRRGLKSVFSTEQAPRLEVVGEAHGGAEGLAMSLKQRPDLVLMDIQLLDGTGVATCRRLRKSLPQTPVVVLTSQAIDALVYDAITAGASGYVLKHISPSALVQSVKDVTAGKSILDSEVTSRVLQFVRSGSGRGQIAGLASLSSQELRVLACVAEGMTNKQAAAGLGLSENTVKNYLGSVFGKLKIKRRSQAAAAYAKHSPRAGR